jgi:hypothetical protein
MGLLSTYGDLWRWLEQGGRRSLGLATVAEVEIDLEHPELRGIEPEDLPAALVTCASAAVVKRRASAASPVAPED